MSPKNIQTTGKKVAKPSQNNTGKKTLRKWQSLLFSHSISSEAFSKSHRQKNTAKSFFCGSVFLVAFFLLFFFFVFFRKTKLCCRHTWSYAGQSSSLTPKGASFSFKSQPSASGGTTNESADVFREGEKSTAKGS